MQNQSRNNNLYSGHVRHNIPGCFENISYPEEMKSRRGFTILELLVTFAIIAILIALILPAVSSAREAARKMQCKNHLRQIGLALHSYHDVASSLPPGWQWESSQQSGYGWAVPILPFLEQQTTYDLIDRNKIIEDIFNTSARDTSFPIFLCPSDLTTRTFTLFEQNSLGGPTALVDLPTANYIGVFGTVGADDSIPAPLGDGTFCESKSVKFAHLQRGLSNTIIVGERTMATVPSTWLGIDIRGEDAACRLVGSAVDSPNCDQCDECDFSSRHPGGTNFLWGDGHVRLVSETIDLDVYQELVRRQSTF